MSSNNKTKIEIDELIQVFSGIDGKIQMLHQDSSRVFMQMNDYLKDYYKKNGIIFGNVSDIFETLAGDGEKGLTGEYELIYRELKKYREVAEKENQQNLDLLNQLSNKLSYIVIVIRNFKQDLTTIKFLITNLRLISSNEKFLKIPEDSIREWEKAAVEVREGLIFLLRELDQVSTHASLLLSKAQAFSDRSLKNINRFYEDLESTNLLISRKNNESKIHFPVFKEKMKNSKDSIGSIITHLQYHDIVRQKIEHIQASHRKIIGGLKEKVQSQEEGTDKVDENYSLIADVAGLQAAQLILISKEYQKALEIITHNFQKIASDLTTVSGISNDFSFEENNSDVTLITRVRERMDRSILMLDKFNFSDFNSDLGQLMKEVENIRILTTEKIFRPLQVFLGHDFPGKEKERSGRNGEMPPSILLQLASLSNDVKDKQFILKEEIDDMTSLTGNFRKRENKEGFGSILEKEQIRIMVDISRLLNRLDDENNTLDNLILQNNNLSQEIIRRMKETIGHVDYYELFEKVLNEIIAELNNINARLGIEYADSEKYRKMENLKEIEALYTVASERIIHNRVIDGSDEMEVSEQGDQSDDVELF